MLFVAEVLDGLEVEQAVDSLGVGLGVGRVHVAADVDAPFGGGIGEADIGDDGDEDHHRIKPAIGPGEDAGDERDFEDGRQGVEQREAQHRVDAHGAARHDARQAAGAAFQVELERQRMQVAEGAHCQFLHGALADLCEDRVTDLGQHHHHDTGEAIGQHEEHDGGDGGGGNVRLAGQRIGCIFEGIGRGHRDDLGEHQRQQRKEHPCLEARVACRPEIGKHVTQDGPFVSIHGDGLVDAGGRPAAHEKSI